MRYMEDKKGQGFDTFKLLIAAVVAMVILGIVTGVFGKIWAMIGGISCVSNPIGEITSKVQAATTGMDVVTQLLCFSEEGEAIRAEKIKERLSNVKNIKFGCRNQAAVCSSGGAIKQTSSEISANRATQFKVHISCKPVSGGFDCTLGVMNP